MKWPLSKRDSDAQSNDTEVDIGPYLHATDDEDSPTGEREGYIASVPSAIQPPSRLRCSSGRQEVFTCCGIAWGYLPWGTLLCLPFLTAALVEYCLQIIKVHQSTTNLLETFGAHLEGFYRIVTMYHVLVVLTAVLVGVCGLTAICGFLRMDQKLRQKGQRAPGYSRNCTYRVYQFLSGSFVAWIYLAMLWLVILVAVLTSSFIALTVLEEATSHAQRQDVAAALTTLEDALNHTSISTGFRRVEDAASAVTTRINNASVTDPVLAVAAVQLQNSVRTYRQTANSLQAAVQAVGPEVQDALAMAGVTLASGADSGNVTTAGNCSSAGCLDLSRYTVLNSQKCICDPSTLAQVQATVSDGRQATIICLICVIVMYLAASFLLARVSAEYVSVCADHGLFHGDTIQKNRDSIVRAQTAMSARRSNLPRPPLDLPADERAFHEQLAHKSASGPYSSSHVAHAPVTVEIPAVSGVAGTGRSAFPSPTHFPAYQRTDSSRSSVYFDSRESFG